MKQFFAVALVAALLLLPEAIRAQAAPGPLHVNESAKTPVVLCGVHTQINAQTLRSIRNVRPNFCRPIAEHQTRPFRRSRVVITHVAPAVIATRLHVPRIPQYVGVAPSGPPVPMITSINTAGWNTYGGGNWISSSGSNPEMMPGLSIVIEGQNLYGPVNQGGPVVNILYAGCNGQNGGGVTIKFANQTKIVGTVNAIGSFTYGEIPAMNAPGQLTIRTAGGTSAPHAVTWVPQLETENDEISVIFPPFATVLNQYFWSGFGPANAQLANSGARFSAFPAYIGGSGDKGEDVVGTNVKLLNGWHVVRTKISAVQSHNDPSDGSRSTITDEPARGARIEATTPGSLVTRVHWWYDANQSVDYDVLWGLQGPYGYRALSTEKLQGGPCEQ